MDHGRAAEPAVLVLDEWARGARARIVRALIQGLESVVALKVPLPGHEDFVGARRGLDREHSALARLDHPGLVRALPVVVPGAVPMQLLPGPTLRHHLDRRGPRPWPEVCGVLASVADALAHVHARGLVHLDVKLSNLVVGPGGFPVLVDFGESVESGRPPRSGHVSPAYAAPELLAGRSVRGAADVYALAASAVQLLSGRRLERAVGPAGLPIPAPLRRLLERMLAEAPDARPAPEEISEISTGLHASDRSESASSRNAEHAKRDNEMTADDDESGRGPLSKQLRGSLQAQHEAVETLPSARALVEGALGEEAYTVLLRGLRGVHRVLEAGWDRSRIGEVLVSVDRAWFARSATCSEDLAWFAARGVVPTEAADAAFDDAARALDDELGALMAANDPRAFVGAVYVSEGSRMGSMVVGRLLADAFEGAALEPGHGLDYHAEGGREVPRRVAAFKDEIDALELDEDVRRLAVEAAHATMRAFHRIYEAVEVAGEPVAVASGVAQRGERER